MMVGSHSNPNQESAVDSFIEKFGGSISSTLECFDHDIFKVYLPVLPRGDRCTCLLGGRNGCSTSTSSTVTLG